METNSTVRLRHIDFLRGIAILLVLVKHTAISSYITNAAWIGVDLFFVLSGFLVAGILFREFIETGKINSKRFLIRRGFKIYPTFWFALMIFLVLCQFEGRQIGWFRFISEIIFIQNYVSGWGYALNGISWSLAVEEHFYFGIAFLFPIFISKNWLRRDERKRWIVERCIVMVMMACLVMRMFSNYYFPYYEGRNWSMTHLRIDSLLAGVLAAYWYYFEKDFLINQYTKYKKLIIPFSLLLISFTPFIYPINSFFVKTIGFTFVFLSFMLLLIYFIMNQDINKILNRYFHRRIVDLISKIGLYSYSIYLFHTFINDFFARFSLHPLLNFVLSNTTSIIAGMLISNYVEYYFLALRDRLYPWK